MSLANTITHFSDIVGEIRSNKTMYNEDTQSTQHRKETIKFDDRDKPVCLSVVDGLSADLDTQLLSSG
ncbi:hypothetical protein Bca4012_073287 [Brassica carinata]